MSSVAAMFACKRDSMLLPMTVTNKKNPSRHACGVLVFPYLTIYNVRRHQHEVAGKV